MEKLIKQALDALVETQPTFSGLSKGERINAAIEALRARLAEPEPEPEPVVCSDACDTLDRYLRDNLDDNDYDYATYSSTVGLVSTPYTIPPTTEGMVLVPIEPTEKMINAYLAANTEYWRDVDLVTNCLTKKATPVEATAVSYKAMIKAAQEAT